MTHLLSLSTLLLAAPIIGKVLSFVFIVRSFVSLGESGGADPAMLASEISSAQWPSVIGFYLGVVGIGISIFIILKVPKPPKWYYRFVFVCSILIAISQFWIGTLLAFILFACLISNRARFWPSTTTEQ